MKKEEMKISDLYSLENTMAKELLEQFYLSVEVLAHGGDFVERLGETLPKDEYANPAEGIWIHKSAHIAPTAGIIAPVIIGPGGRSASLRIHPRKSYCWQRVLW